MLIAIKELFKNIQYPEAILLKGEMITVERFIAQRGEDSEILLAYVSSAGWNNHSNICVLKDSFSKEMQVKVEIAAIPWYESLSTIECLYAPSLKDDFNWDAHHKIVETAPIMMLVFALSRRFNDSSSLYLRGETNMLQSKEEILNPNKEFPKAKGVIVFCSPNKHLYQYLSPILNQLIRVTQLRLIIYINK